MSADSIPSSKTNIFFKTNSSIVAILELIRGYGLPAKKCDA